MAARLVQSAAGPLEKPTEPSTFAVLGVASNWASKAPVWEAIVRFCQAPALVTQFAAVMVSAAVPLLPSLVAVIVALPVATPVTRPLAETVATALLLVAQLTVRPVSVLPAASLVTAASCAVALTKGLADAGLTVTAATGTLVTAVADVPLFPSLVSVIVAEPAVTPVTDPLAPTGPTGALLLAHSTTRPPRAVPFESFGAAVNWVVAPTARLAAAGLTVTDATGTLLMVTAAVSASVPPF